MTIIRHDLLPPSRWGSHAKSGYERISISPYIRHLRLDISSCAPFIVYRNRTSGDKLPDRGTEVRKNKVTEQKWPREIQSSTYSIPWLSTSCYLSCIVARPETSVFCYSRSPSLHPSNLTSVYPVPAFHFRHQHPSSNTVLIHSLHVYKRSQCSLIRSTR